LTHYLGNIKFYLGAGGSVKEMVIGDYVNKGLLENLHLEATKEDLEELIEEFIVIRDIQIRLPEPGKFTKSAVVFFNSQRDFYRFYDYFNDCEYLGHTLKVTSIKKSKLDFAWEKQYIEFKWYVWQTHNKALIRFASEEGAKAALEAFKANPELDGVKVEVAIEGKNVTIDQLNDITDEIFIDEALRNYGAIEEV
jgi:RNA recognition motif-containing protein